MQRAMQRTTSQMPVANMLSPMQKKVFVVKGACGPIPRLVLELLAALDGRRTLEEACVAARISVARGLAIVRKLSELGWIEQAPAPSARTFRSQPPEPAPPARPAARPRSTARVHRTVEDSSFSSMEEEFFSAEVTVPDEEPWRMTTPGEGLGRLLAGLAGMLRRAPARP